MAETVYILCTLTSLACAVLLLRGYARTRSRLLLWAGLCFAALTIDNSILFVDLAVIPDVDLGIWRNGFALLGVSLLVFGLVWESV